jgi:hypothetical protein
LERPACDQEMNFASPHFATKFRTLARWVAMTDTLL